MAKIGRRRCCLVRELNPAPWDVACASFGVRWLSEADCFVLEVYFMLKKIVFHYIYIFTFYMRFQLISYVQYWYFISFWNQTDNWQRCYWWLCRSQLTANIEIRLFYCCCWVVERRETLSEVAVQYTGPKESFRLWCVVECDLKMRRPCSAVDRCAK
jgi:hypothetical protein